MCACVFDKSQSVMFHSFGRFETFYSTLNTKPYIYIYAIEYQKINQSLVTDLKVFRVQKFLIEVGLTFKRTLCCVISKS